MTIREVTMSSDELADLRPVDLLAEAAGPKKKKKKKKKKKREGTVRERFVRSRSPGGAS